MSNFQKNLLVFVAMISAMALVAYLSFDVYQQVLILFGAFSIGRAVSNWSETRWPL